MARRSTGRRGWRYGAKAVMAAVSLLGTSAIYYSTIEPDWRRTLLGVVFACVCAVAIVFAPGRIGGGVWVAAVIILADWYVTDPARNDRDWAPEYANSRARLHHRPDHRDSKHPEFFLPLGDGGDPRLLQCDIPARPAGDGRSGQRLLVRRGHCAYFSDVRLSGWPAFRHFHRNPPAEAFQLFHHRRVLSSLRIVLRGRRRARSHRRAHRHTA